MPSSYELHKESAEARDAAKKRLEETGKQLAEAERNEEEAAATYRRILEEAEREVAPEVIAEAYEEYSGYLQGKLLEDAQKKNWQEVDKISKNLQELERDYGRPTIPGELTNEIEAFLKKKGIAIRSEREHYLNRSKYLFEHGKSREEIMEMLERESKEVPQANRMIPDSNRWAGGRKK